MKEAEFDEFVSPLLMQAAKETERLNGVLVTFSQYDGAISEKVEIDFPEPDSCTTRMMGDNPSAHAQLVDMAARCKGNLDSLCMGLAKLHHAGKMDLSQTMLAHWMKLEPFSRPQMSDASAATSAT